MWTGLRLSNNLGVATVENCTFLGLAKGIETIDTSLDVKGSTFRNVGSAVSSESASTYSETLPRHDVQICATSSTYGYQGHQTSSSPYFPLPSLCPKCMKIFHSRNYHTQSSPIYGFEKEETHFECNAPNARLAFDLIALIEETITTLSAVPLMGAILAAINTPAADVFENKISIEAAEEVISEIVPAMATVASKAKSLDIQSCKAYYLTLALVGVLAERLNLWQALAQDDPARRRYEVDAVCKAAMDIAVHKLSVEG